MKQILPYFLPYFDNLFTCQALPVHLLDRGYVDTGGIGENRILRDFQLPTHETVSEKKRHF
jgi:hypothetical protein